jgi:hypothetical protein
MYLSKRGFGVASGFFFGIIILLITYLALIIENEGNTLSKISTFLKGYSVSWAGGLIGFVWGFILGFGIGFSFAFVYNVTINSIKKIKSR